jgi:hypothetical protein
MQNPVIDEDANDSQCHYRRKKPTKLYSSIEIDREDMDWYEVHLETNLWKLVIIRVPCTHINCRILRCDISAKVLRWFSTPADSHRDVRETVNGWGCGMVTSIWSF